MKCAAAVPSQGLTPESARQVCHRDWRGRTYFGRMRAVEQDLKSAAAIDTLELVEDTGNSVSVIFDDAPPPPAPADGEGARP